VVVAVAMLATAVAVETLLAMVARAGTLLLEVTLARLATAVKAATAVTLQPVKAQKLTATKLLVTVGRVVLVDGQVLPVTVVTLATAATVVTLVPAVQVVTVVTVVTVDTSVLVTQSLLLKSTTT
jgi:uncharacterized protein (DUF58 family)